MTRKTKKPKPEIAKVLVVATNHVPEGLAVENGQGVVPMAELAQMVNEYGWMLNVDIDRDFGALDHLAYPVKAILLFAKKRGCRYVLFDRDADELEGFPVFDW